MLLRLYDSKQRPVTSSCDDDNEILGSIKCGEFPE